MSEYVQDKVDAAVESTRGGDNRVTETVLAVRDQDGRVTLHRVGTEERVRYHAGSDRGSADRGIESGYMAPQECWDHRRDDDDGVFEFRYWSEEDEYRDSCDVIASAAVEVPWLYAGTVEERTEYVCELARVAMVEAGDLAADEEIG